VKVSAIFHYLGINNLFQSHLTQLQTPPTCLYHFPIPSRARHSSPKSLAELTESYEKSLTVADTTTIEEDITTFDTDARKNIDTNFSLVPFVIVNKPKINYIYSSQHRTRKSSVPVNLQLSWYPENWSEVCVCDLFIMDD
jgi:hypothetical protein